MWLAGLRTFLKIDDSTNILYLVKLIGLADVQLCRRNCVQDEQGLLENRQYASSRIISKKKNV